MHVNIREAVIITLAQLGVYIGFLLVTLIIGIGTYGMVKGVYNLFQLIFSK